MIQTERFTINGREFIRTYSDAGRYIVGGNPEGEYEEATDPADTGRTYVEGDLIPLSDGEPEDEQALTRYINENTGTHNTDLVSATETLIRNNMED